MIMITIMGGQQIIWAGTVMVVGTQVLQTLPLPLRSHRPCYPAAAADIKKSIEHVICRRRRFHISRAYECRCGNSGITAGSSGGTPKDSRDGKKEILHHADEIIIRRRPTTGPALHYVGPFEFRLENEGNTPRNILEEIVWNKDKEVMEIKGRLQLANLKKKLSSAPQVRDFIGALRERQAETGFPALIAEVKKASPIKGIIRPDFDPVKIALAYQKGGAACISVLTDSKYFQGSFDNLQAIRSAGIKCPLLCKEFIIDAWQLYYARLHGADAVLLIASILPDQDIYYMTKICKILGMAALVEVHSLRELDRVLEIDGIKLIGINNQNPETCEVDINKTVELLAGDRCKKIVDKNILVVTELDLFTPDDIALVRKAGAKAVLVGETVLKENDPGAGITSLFGKDISVQSRTKSIQPQKV